MAISAIYLKEGASQTVEYGRRVSATDIWQVKDIQVETNQISDVIRTVLDSTVIPADGASYSTGDPDLKVVRRKVFDFERLPNSALGVVYTCKVQIDFELFRPQDEATYPIAGSASLNSVETAIDRNGNQVKATFDGSTVAGKLTVLEPRISETITLTKQTDAPSAFAFNYVGRVNNADWRGAPRGSWLCIAVNWRVVHEPGAPNNTYEFTFEFEYNGLPEGWSYRFYFTNSDGTIPDGVTIGNGITIIGWHYEQDFGSIFGP